MARPLGCDSVADGRGVAVADFDRDGRLDVAINNNAARPTIYFNNQTRAGNWLRVKLVGRGVGSSGPGSNRDALGARVQVVVDLAGTRRTITRWVEAGSGYASQSESTLHFGLAAAPRVESLAIVWPDGRRQDFEGAELMGRINQTMKITEGSGRIEREPLATMAVARSNRPVAGNPVDSNANFIDGNHAGGSTPE